MMRARRTKMNDSKPRIAFSKASAQTWMGESVFELCVLLLTFIQV